MLFTNTQQSFKFSSFIKRSRGRGRVCVCVYVCMFVGKRPNKPNTKRKKIIKDIEGKQKRNKPRLTTQLGRAEDDRGLTESHTIAVCTSVTEVATHGEGSHVALRPAAPRTRAHARPALARTLAHTHGHTQTRPRAAGPGRRASPVRVLLYVIIRGGTIKEAGVEGLPLLPSGEDAGDGAESHLLFLLFPFLVFKILE